MTDPLGAAGAMAQAQVRALVQNASALGLTWTLRPATVSIDSPITAVFDGDTNGIGMTSLIGPVAVGQRVFVLIIPPSGNYIVGSRDPDPDRRALSRHQRSELFECGAQTTAIWNQVDEDNGAGATLKTSTTTFTIPLSGLWAITFVPTLSGVGGTRNFGAINVTSRLTGAPTIYRASYDAGEDRTQRSA